MERILEGLGAVCAWIFFLLGFFMGNQWLWGCAVGAVISGFGMIYDS